MLKDVVTATVVGAHRLHIRFEDGVEGDVDVSKLVRFSGVFEPLRDPEYFARVRVNREIGTVVWPNDADLDPDVLYAEVRGEKIVMPV